jgi:ABC-type lipoprotein release transport system permease subunit
MVAILVTVALVASVVPAQRATRLEPASALRVE